MISRADTLRRLLASDFPLAARLGASVVEVSSGGITIAAPLAFNRNHEGTAFGGSLNAVTTLAGWCAVWLILEEAGLEGPIVIQDSAVRYRRPVTRDFTAHAVIDSNRSTAFVEGLKRKRKARITIDVTVDDEAGPAVLFAGRYVVQLAG